MKEETKQKSKFKKGCLGCLGAIIVCLILLNIITGIFFIRWPIYGRVSDKETGRPIENALVVFSWRTKHDSWQEYDATITDKNGKYKLPIRIAIFSPITGGEWGPLLDKRDGCVLVAWFPGYFRSEKWQGTDMQQVEYEAIGFWKYFTRNPKKRLISWRNDFELQKAKTREEVVRSLEESIDEGKNGVFMSWGNICPGRKWFKIKIYNPYKKDICAIYRRIYEDYGKW